MKDYQKLISMLTTILKDSESSITKQQQDLEVLKAMVTGLENN